MSRLSFGAFEPSQSTQLRKKLIMKMIVYAVIGLCLMLGTQQQVARAAALVQPISTSTAIYAGIQSGPDTAVFSHTIDITGVGTELRIPKIGGMNAGINGMPVNSILVLSEVLTSNASTEPIFQTEFVVPNGQTRRFTITDTFQATQTGWLGSYFERINWRQVNDPFGSIRTVMFTPTFQSAAPAEIQSVVVTPEPTSIALLLSGALGLLARRKRPA
jgi:hypothetical protein